MDKDNNNNNSTEDDINFDQHEADGVETLKSKGNIFATLGTPNKAVWFKCNPDFKHEFTLAKGTVGSGPNAITRTYLVDGKTKDIHKSLKESLDNCYRANCVLFCTTNHFWGIWSFKVTEKGEAAHIAHTTAATQFDRACNSFLKMRYIDHSVGYFGKEPIDTELFAKKEPEWPDKSKWRQILIDAFKGHVIRDLDHPVYLSAIGKHVT